ncbi:transcription initiation factor IIA subunit 1-like isoform X2 [Rhynchophorus ferrugineus]|uniref:transcription initiation factor IIA subunit 1-like isoform X2 n=1 Tax=Rhynchophorus ferrugineus TaxID=354439 RepID=UPI003FCCE625
MSNSLCKSSVSKAYQEVIADVIQNVREHFVEDGVDEIVLQELKTLWETKLANTKAVEDVKEIDKLIAVNKNQKTQQNPIQHNFLNPLAQQHNSVNNQPIGQVPPNNHIPQAVAFPEWKRVPVKLTIPSPSGCNTPDKRILSIYVPELFLQGDGSHDSSDDEQIDDEDEDDNDNEDADDAADENDDGNQEVIEDEPLNSEDDVSDADGTEESFDTENVIVCQFDKITRARNRWKFHLKDGIMNLNGEDYVFQKANGDAEW